MIMKSKVVLLVAVLALAPIAAAKADNDVGCGFGTALWEGKTGLPFKIFAATTNLIGSQTILITFGLLNCSDGTGNVTASAQTRHFAATSFDNIARDAAFGGGESLDTLAALLLISPADRPAFANLAQSHFAELFPANDVTSNEMLETLVRLMQQDARLAIYARG